jgi:penicillin-binding protein 2
VSTLVHDPPVSDRRPLRFVAFGIAVVIGISGLSARLFYLQVSQGVQYAQIATQNRTVQQAIPSTRGLIFDRAGRPLVQNEPSFSVKVRPVDLPLSRRDEVVARLADLLQMDTADINASIDENPGSRFDLVRVAQDVPRDVADIIAEETLALPGVEVDVETQRHYLDGALVAQILGYTGAIDSAELAKLKDKGYLSDDLLGKAGVESVYEPHLRGSYGLETVERDASGRKLQVLETNKQPVAGESLQLTIDTREQQLALKALNWAMKTARLKSGVMIVMNPQTGEVLAMVSVPTYDSNKFATGISQKDFQKYAKDPNQPMLNHAINEQYPPGSTYKLVTGLGALSDGRITPTTVIGTHPYITIGSTRFWDWNHAGFGPLNIRSGFAHSSDTFFYQVAQRLGISRLAYWAHQFGFGSPTGIDLPGEAAGIVPSDNWKQNTFGQPMFEGETVQAGIGQGYDVATPLQVLNAYCALANGGRLLRPQVVRQIVGPDGNVTRPFKPRLIRNLPTSSRNLDVMREAARMVVTSHHTYNLVELPIPVAGKTGTAQFGVKDSKGRLPFHEWFVAFVSKSGSFTKHDSQLAVLGFAENANTVGNVATEMVKYYLQLHFKLKVDKRLPYLLHKGNFYGN